MKPESLTQTTHEILTSAQPTLSPARCQISLERPGKNINRESPKMQGGKNL